MDAQAAQLVTALLMAYGLGMPAYLGRDVLVRVFYALGDGTTPFLAEAAVDIYVQAWNRRCFPKLASDEILSARIGVWPRGPGGG